MSTNCLVTKMKGVVNNPNLPILGDVVYDGTLTKVPEGVDKCRYYANIGAVDDNTRYAAILTSNIDLSSFSQQLDLYIKGDTVISNIVDIRNNSLLTPVRFDLTTTNSTESGSVNVFCGAFFNDVVLSAKVIKLSI